MARYRFYVLLAAFSSLTVFGHGQLLEKSDVMLVPILPAPDMSSQKDVTKEDTTITTTSKDTTAPKTVPDTTVPDTTTTTSPTTTTTTSSSTSTTTVAPTPGPLPPPDQGSWSYTQDNVTCILVQFAAQLNITYTKAVDNSTVLDYVRLNVPANASVVGGNCTGSEQWLNISWPSRNSSNSLVMVFAKNDTTREYALKNLNVSVAADVFPNATFSSPLEFWHGAEWSVPLAKSYRCVTPTQLNLTAESTSGAATLTLSRLQEEAFRSEKSKGFSAARECGGGDLPDAVPIAVGCALGGLVLVVLIAYLVGRRRSAARGYLSM